MIFALANPDPEIGYTEAKAARPDAIVATGRSDFPNQVNNVLGFPYVFRGALDVRAKEINEAMKIAAAHALAALAHEPVPDSVADAYGVHAFRFGPDYIIPKPFDTRVLWWCAPAVAEAAMKSGAARLSLDLDEYRERLQRRIGGVQHTIMRQIVAAREERPQADRLPRRRQHQGAARLPDRAGREASPTRSCWAASARSASAPPSWTWTWRAPRSSARPSRRSTRPTPTSTWRCAAARGSPRSAPRASSTGASTSA